MNLQEELKDEVPQSKTAIIRITIHQLFREMCEKCKETLISVMFLRNEKNGILDLKLFTPRSVLLDLRDQVMGQGKLLQVLERFLKRYLDGSEFFQM